MAQKVLFPGTHMRITQDEYGSTSHKGSLARDDGGESTAFDSPVFAPFDGYFARVRTDSSHETYFVSDGPVECANGYVGVVTFLFMHDNVNRFPVGAHAKQGEIIGYEGGFGGGQKDRFAHHTHREWSKGKNTTQSRNTSGTYVIANQMHEYDVCFLRQETMVNTGGTNFKAAKDFTGTVKDNAGHVFKVYEGGSSVKPISNESIVLKIYAPSGAAISAGDVVLLENVSKPLGITLKAEGGALITEQAVSAGDQIVLIEKAQSLGLACEENVDKTEPLSPDAVTMCIGPASSGDRAAIQKKAQELGLGYREEEGGCIVGPASAGDQVLVLTLAQSLGLPYEIYKPPETSSEVEELKAQLADMTAQRDEALKRAQTAEKNAGQYLTMIEAAKTALGV